MEHSPSWESDSYWAGKKSLLFMEPKALLADYKCLPLIAIVSHLNLVHVLTFFLTGF